MCAFVECLLSGVRSVLRTLSARSFFAVSSARERERLDDLGHLELRTENTGHDTTGVACFFFTRTFYRCNGRICDKKHSCVLISKSDHIFVWDTLSCDKDRRTINRKLSNVMKVVYKDSTQLYTTTATATLHN